MTREELQLKKVNKKRRVKRTHIPKSKVKTIYSLYFKFLNSKDNKKIYPMTIYEFVEQFNGLTNREKRVFNACTKGMDFSTYMTEDKVLYIRSAYLLPFKQISKNLKNASKKLSLNIPIDNFEMSAFYDNGYRDYCDTCQNKNTGGCCSCNLDGNACPECEIYRDNSFCQDKHMGYNLYDDMQLMCIVSKKNNKINHKLNIVPKS